MTPLSASSSSMVTEHCMPLSRETLKKYSINSQSNYPKNITKEDSPVSGSLGSEWKKDIITYAKYVRPPPVCS